MADVDPCVLTAEQVSAVFGELQQPTLDYGEKDANGGCSYHGGDTSTMAVMPGDRYSELMEWNRTLSRDIVIASPGAGAEAVCDLVKEVSAEIRSETECGQVQNVPVVYQFSPDQATSIAVIFLPDRPWYLSIGGPYAPCATCAPAMRLAAEFFISAVG